MTRDHPQAAHSSELRECGRQNFPQQALRDMAKAKLPDPDACELAPTLAKLPSAPRDGRTACHLEPAIFLVSKLGARHAALVALAARKA